MLKQFYQSLVPELLNFRVILSVNAVPSFHKLVHFILTGLKERFRFRRIGSPVCKALHPVLPRTADFTEQCSCKTAFAACKLKHEDELAANGSEQLSLFTDYGEGQKKKAAEQAAEEKEKSIQTTVLDLQHRYGKNAVIKGMNLKEGATTIERNTMIGGHKG